MTDSVLKEVVALVEASPHGGESLTLYALMSTLRMDKSGYMFLLRKLRDLQPQHRQLAYQLMELMAENGNQGEAWESALVAIDTAMKKGSL